MKGYSARIDTLLDRLGLDGRGLDVTEQDFAELAIACLDQAGLPVADQLAVRRIVDRAMETRSFLNNKAVRP